MPRSLISCHNNSNIPTYLGYIFCNLGDRLTTGTDLGQELFSPNFGMARAEEIHTEIVILVTSMEDF